MRLLICAGGTGGGVYPALAVLQALGNNRDSLLWVGGKGGMEAGLVQRAGISFKTIPAAGVHGVGLRSLPGNVLKLINGFFASRRILKEFKPDVLFFTGGYVAVPMALAGWRLPSLVFVPDIEPGLAIKFISRFANRITVSTDEARKYYESAYEINVSGYPVRKDLAGWTQETGRKALELSADYPVLFVFGGSKGARSINMALLANLEKLLDITQIVHITGELDWPDIESARRSLSTLQRKNYRAFPYLHDKMGAALAAADLVVSRSGASILGEFPLFGLPAILVPYPYAWRYQKINADFLTSQGAAMMIEDSKLEKELFPVVKSLLESPARMMEMRKAMRALSHPQAAQNIAAQLRELAGERE